MRLIKFRGKRSDNGEWIEGDFLTIGGFPYIHHQTDNEIGSQTVERDTVGQCTALKDVTGKFIYEGDVLQVRDGNEADDVLEVRYVRGVFAFLWGGSLDDECCSGTPTHLWAKVIGNIHDNPELIKEI